MKRELKGSHLRHLPGLPGHCKAHPDEKGTESCDLTAANAFQPHIARPIPMKRELKEVKNNRRQSGSW